MKQDSLFFRAFYYSLGQERDGKGSSHCLARGKGWLCKAKGGCERRPASAGVGLLGTSPPGSRGARKEGTWLSLLPGGQGRIWHLVRDEAGVVLKAPAVQALAWFRRSASLAPRTGNGSVCFSGSGKYVGLILEVASVVVPVTKAGARGGALSYCQGEIPRWCEQDSPLG